MLSAVQRKKFTMKIPNATKTTSGLSGIAFGLIIMTGGLLGGSIQVVLGIFGVFWFLFSVVMLVIGRKPLEYNNDWLKWQRSYWDAKKEVAPRFLIWFVSTALTIATVGRLFK